MNTSCNFRVETLNLEPGLSIGTLTYIRTSRLDTQDPPQ